MMSSINILAPLTLDEERERLHLERKVERAFYEAGLALQTLRDKRLWRATHNSFKEYCQDRFCYSRDYAYKLIDTVEISKTVYGDVDNCLQSETIVLATAESQLRPLKQLKEPEQQRQAWARAVEKAGGKVPTAKIVREVVNQIKPKETKAKKTKVEQNQNGTQPKIKYVPLVKAELGQSVRVKSTHALFPLQQGKIVQLPNSLSVIIMLEDSTRELINIKDLEMQRIVDKNGKVSAPSEGPNRIPGMGLEWYVRLDEETWNKLNQYAQKVGTATLGSAVAQLLESNKS